MYFRYLNGFLLFVFHTFHLEIHFLLKFSWKITFNIVYMMGKGDGNNSNKETIKNPFRSVTQ